MTQENTWGNNTILLMWVIIALLLVIAVMGFFLWKKQWGTEVNNTTVVTKAVEGEDSTDSASTDNGEDTKKVEKKVASGPLKITVINDKRCNNCQTSTILDQLKTQPSIKDVEIVEKDFSEEGVEQYLKDNKVTKLPLFAFSTKDFDTSKDQGDKKINDFLQELPGGEYFLQVGAQFDPFVERSERGFMMLDKEKLSEILNDSHNKGNKDAKIAWLEYSDVECPFCAKLHTEWTDTALIEKYGDDLNIVFQHFPLGFHANAQVWAEILECVADQEWVKEYYSLIAAAFKDGKSDKDYLYKEAGKLWAKADKLDKCLDEEEFTQKVKDQMARGTELFGVTGTPGNVLINTTTWEYEVISWAYPKDAFIEIIDKLLAE